MRREDLGRTTDDPPTLEDALRVPDLEDEELIKSLWDDLADAPVVEPPVAPGESFVGPAAEPFAVPAADPATEDEPDGADREPEPYVPEVEVPLTRRQAKRRRRELKDLKKVEKLRLRRHRILPRTVIGIATMLLFFGLGIGVAGAILYAYYDWRLSENEQRVGELSASLEDRLVQANEELDLSGANAIQAIRREVRPLRALLAEERVVGNLTGRLDGSVWFVETLDENGAPAVGSAFVAASEDTESLLVTSFGAVAAATTEPAPTIGVRSGDETLEATLYNWDPEHDLALLVLPRGGLEPLPWADNDSLAHIVGARVWAAEGIGGNGVSVSPGSVIDSSDVGLQHTAALNQAFRGGPLVNGRGEVVGIASIGYAPLNYAGGDVSFGVPVQAACERILNCTGDVPGAGSDR